MASDWIKFRRSLLTDGRVRKMSATLRTNVREVLGALVIFWCLADEHADENGELFGWSFDEMDGLVGINGFCSALPECWIDMSGEWVKCPEFLEHNGSTAKRRAEDTKRKRSVRKMSKICPQNVRSNAPSSSLLLSSLNNNKRKEKATPEIELPESINRPDVVRAVADWLAYKTERRETYTKTGQAGLVKKLAALGPDRAIAAIENSIASNYAGIFEPKTANGSSPGQTFKTAHERKLEREAALVARAKELDALKEAQRNDTQRSDRRNETRPKPMAPSGTFGTPDGRRRTDLRGNRVSGSPSINGLVAKVSQEVCADTGRDSRSGANRATAESAKQSRAGAGEQGTTQAAESLGPSSGDDQSGNLETQEDFNN